jgi:hypothetical protein
VANKARDLTQVEAAMVRMRRRPPARQPRLYAFLLFDERKSQRPVAAFAEDQFAWLDQLAGSTRIVLFIFVTSDAAQEVSPLESQVLAVEAAESVGNPSLRVAAAFNLRPRDLPGLLFFTTFDLEHGPNAGVYWPLSLELFEGDRQSAEAELAELFSLVQEVVPSAGTPEQALRSLDLAVRHARVERARAPIFDVLRTGLVRVVSYPAALIEAIGKAWAEEYARRMMPDR